MAETLPNDIRRAMESKPSGELLAIWNAREEGHYTNEALGILRLVLKERGVETPESESPSPRLALGRADLTTSTLEATRQLCAAAHLHHSAIYEPLRARFDDPDNLKADTPEYFIDIALVWKEASIAHRRETVRRWVVATTAAVGMLAMSGGAISLVSLTLGALGLIELLFELQRQRYVRSRFLAAGSAPALPQPAAVNVTQNVVISGGFSPFVGSGYDILGWSFVVDLTKPSDDVPPRHLTPSELYEEVAESLNRLSIPNLAMCDKLFINGDELRGYGTILPNHLGKPQTQVPQAVVQEAVGLALNHVRHYRVLQIPAWGAQLVLSVFLRFTAIGESLFVEARFFLLPPLRAGLRAVDNLTDEITFRQLMGILIVSAVKAPFTWIGAVIAGYAAVHRVFEAMGSEQRKIAENNERFNYGWATSLREQWAGSSYERYFQMLDKDMYSKILQARILDTIVRTLEDRGISTDALKDRGTTILNQGLIVSGGSVEAQNLAIGRKAVIAVQQAIGGGAKASPPSGGSDRL